jgi:PPM family protein phosphatase
MTPAFGFASSVGRVRELNEDAVLAEPDIYAVADGMGGHAAGEVAAALALEALTPLAGRTGLRPDDVLAAIAAGNVSILAFTSQQAETVGMGTTISGICLGAVGGSPHWFIFNVGDSRVYRYANRELVQVTVDHSEVHELVASGRISSEDARTHPRRNVVTRSLGSDPAPSADMWVVPANAGDRYLICSDGLTSEVVETEIADVLGCDLEPQLAADTLVAMAEEAGGHDNISVIVVELPGAADETPVEVTTAPRGRLAQGNG